MQGQHLVLFGRVAAAVRERREAVVEDIQEVPGPLPQQLAGLIVEIHHDHAAFIERIVGAEIQPHAADALPCLERQGLHKSLIRDIYDLAVVIVDDLKLLLIAEPELQLIADPAAEQPYRSCGGQRRQQTADCAAGRECFFHSPPFWQCAESYLLKSGAEAQRAACVPLYSTQAKNANHACSL